MRNFSFHRFLIFSSCMILLLALIPVASGQCDNCTAGTYCDAQDNSGDANIGLDDTSTTYSCAPCISGCDNCTNSSNCNSCESGYVLYTQQNSPEPYIINYQPTTITCAQCPSNCVSCSNPDTCDQCAQGYSGNGSYCAQNDLDVTTVGTNSNLNTNFKMFWVFAIIGGVVAIGVIATLSFYCVNKRKNSFKFAVEEPYSAKQEMIANQTTFPTPKTFELK